MHDDVDGLPLLTEKFLIAHPLACRTWGCRRPVQWTDVTPNRMTWGYCDEHKTRDARVRVWIHGREGHGWTRWPQTLAQYLRRAK